MRIIAHRGFHYSLKDKDICPENTIESFQKAIDLNVDGIETDLRLSSQGELILSHSRAFNGDPVASLTRKELSDLAGYHVPILEELLEIVPEELLLNLDVKTSSCLGPTMELIENFPNLKFLISSFSHSLLHKFARLCLPYHAFYKHMENVEFGLLFANKPYKAKSFFESLPYLPNIEYFIWDIDIFDVALMKNVNEIAKTHGRELKHIVYGVQKEDFSGYNLDGIITEIPDHHVKVRS